MKKRIWTKEELTIAYYIAKYQLSGIEVKIKDLAEIVIGGTTVRSLQMQIANFRHILNIDGYSLKDASKAMYEVVKKLDNKTKAQVRSLVISTINKSKTQLQNNEISRHNKEVELRRVKLNETIEDNYIAKLKAYMSCRKLKRVA